MTPDNIFNRYEEIRDRLPQLPATTASAPLAALQHVENLGILASSFDAFLFDAFGVLNVGEDTIDSSVERFAELQSLGKKLYILTNSASYQKQDLVKKFQNLGYNVSEQEIISSREILIHHIETQNLILDRTVKNLGVISICELSDFPADIQKHSNLNDKLSISTPEEESFWEADEYVFLSSARWEEAQQAKLLNCLKENPKPVYVGNPDIVAPRVGYFSLEPGYFAHQIMDQTEASVEFFGKPYSNTFEYAISRIRDINPAQSLDRILMLGDTLHTDILGGSASGIKTALITDHGAYAGRDVWPYVTNSGIRPDFVIPTI